MGKKIDPIEHSRGSWVWDDVEDGEWQLKLLTFGAIARCANALEKLAEHFAKSPREVRWKDKQDTLRFNVWKQISERVKDHIATTIDKDMVGYRTRDALMQYLTQKIEDEAGLSEWWIPEDYEARAKQTPMPKLPRKLHGSGTKGQKDWSRYLTTLPPETVETMKTKGPTP